ncbi:fimbrial protein [uncultured Parabacteroides sp.]|jgi:hypothetical protein|uniref:fimbrial protein n=1 Tax=uncultured Parabacteroides sp. TaxID=512312 RepID=UPI0026005A8E|nr:fimbrial protein [uncultured Parabacteroides sp.]
MIHSNKNLICLLISLLACVACTDETLIGPKVEEGVLVTATISFQSTDPTKIETRATDISEENRVGSLAVFIFKMNGEKVGETHICSAEELQNKTVKITTTSGSRYIYAIANYQNSLFNLKTDDLEKISTIKELKRLSTQLLQESISVLDGEFLMSGWVVSNGKEYDYNRDQSCSISTNGTVDGKILLKHVMSSIMFKVACVNTAATFVPTSWQLKQIPKNTNIFEQENDYNETDAVYFKSKANADFSKEGDYNIFSFLMMENRKKMKNTDIIVDEYDKREMTNGKPEHFEVANDNSAYLVLEGTYEGETTETVNNVDGSKYVKAQVTYYIHLGLWKVGDKTDFTNFDIFRNNRYTYTVNISGVDKLIVEVEKSGADNENWGGDGDMFLSSQRVRTFDAHYETTVISFSKRQILDLIAEYGITADGGDEALQIFKQNFLIQAATPRNKFVSDETDLDWVEYRRNPKDVTTFAKYRDSNDPTCGNPFNADEFKTDLFNAASDPDYEDSDSIRYTCFIDEYYYGGPGGGYDPFVGLPLKDFINTQPRTIQICTYFRKNDLSSSTLSMAAYTFSQRPICTIFDLDYLEKSGNGWGTEWSQEGEGLPVKNLTYKNGAFQGRTNMVGFLNLDNPNSKGKWSWNSYINYQNNELNKKYAEYACLSRNRDLDGNGVIDDNELRWYLPSVKQYLGFVVGEDALPKEARLYNQENGGSNSDYSYVSSSAYITGYYVLLAYEGAAVGYHKEKNDYPYRCIRNLRNVSNDAVNFVVTSNNHYGENTAYFYSFERLNSKAKRSNVSGALTFGHNAFDEENRLPEIFYVGDWISNEDGSVNAGLASSSNPCAEKKGTDWRLPNQKELAVIIYNRVDDREGMEISKSYFSCTKSVTGDLYYGYDHSKFSLVEWGSTTTTVSDTPSNIGYRCIQDKK